MVKNLGLLQPSSSDDELTVSQWMPRFYYSHYHVTAAAFFARQSAQIERNNPSGNPGSSEDFLQHRAYVTGCIFSSVSFLEAQINEVFTDASEDKRDFIHPLGDRIFLFAEMWRLDVPRRASFPILKKYEIALALAQKDPFDRGGVIYQDTKLLIELRNALIHYEPLSATGSVKASRDQEERFRGKFALNPLTGSKTPFFPERCMGHGCAQWAVTTSLRFVDHFCERLSIKPFFDSVRESLNTVESK